ncbi:MAG: DUF4230 domain-containing protein [Duncaniella sp.]|nr:DUF4230 domain-containing protein [Muribaculum sp.]MCM1254632.1 DUF4230 domain-containing protein [Duncaniella sp.]
MKKLIFFFLLITTVAAMTLCWVRTSKHKANSTPSTIEDVKRMVKLCALEIHDDVPMRDSINGKWIFAKGRMNGYITFDVEKMEYHMEGDTLYVTLPPEVVEIYESTDKDSYRVYDTWDKSFLGVGQLTTAEENILKERMKQRYVRSVYDCGYVDRARKTAIETLTNLLSHFPIPIVVEYPL